jgi:uncharacterized protein with NRDE domain
MCLLVLEWDPEAEIPLILGANRDERYERAAAPFGVFREHGPRILAGTDLLAGGTWLAINEHGVVAGLTNRPVPEGRDPSRSSRGELPIIAASMPTSKEGVAAIAERVRPGEFNPCWMLVGDRESLHVVDVGDEHGVEVTPLATGTHILENKPIVDASAKADHVKALMHLHEADGDPLDYVLANHDLPSGTGPADETPEALMRHLVQAACVHTERYGTRCSTKVRVAAARSAMPEVTVSEAAPCRSPFVDMTHLWRR